MVPAVSVHPDRIRLLSPGPAGGAAAAGGRYVLYWMQQSQRVADNPALAVAWAEAARLGRPLLVGFGLTERYPEANARHFAFMLEGLAGVAGDLAALGVPLVVRRGAPDRVALDLAAAAALVVCDRGYLRHQRAWRQTLAERAPCPVVQVDGDVVVPVDVASNRHEYAARTLRPRLMRCYDSYLDLPDRPGPPGPPLPPAGADLPAGDIDPADPAGTLARLDLDRSVPPVRRFTGGAAAAGARLDRFITQALARYAAERGQPAAGVASELSPYLHFGQISPVRIVQAVRAAAADDPQGSRAAFLEELIVRRELAVNHALHHAGYDRYDGLPDWAQATLRAHAADRRPQLYDADQLAAGRSADRAWNAAMREARVTGMMHNHLRMYWGKKILEWSATPQQAFDTALMLNNRYLLDGRDANSYANIGWLFGLHDRPWPERPIFGTVRSMTAAGLERKIHVPAYCARVDALVAAES